jgi:hypothetical protein
VLTGTGFRATSAAENKVLIGDIVCAVTSFSTTQLTCTPGKVELFIRVI